MNPTGGSGPDACPHRYQVRWDAGREVAHCGILRTLVGSAEDLAEVQRDACEACCRTTAPTAERINSVLASLLYTRCQAVVESGEESGLGRGRAAELGELAQTSLAWEVPEELGVGRHVSSLERRAGLSCRHLGEPVEDPPADRAGIDPEYTCRHPDHSRTTPLACHRCRDWSDPEAREAETEPRRVLSSIPPPAAGGNRLRFSSWAVGVTTAPRARPTLHLCLDTLLRAGWEDGWIFADSEVPLAPRHQGFSSTLRQRIVGAWPNYYLALSELVLRYPEVEAYLLLQDDATLYDREDVRRYLEGIAWPADSTAAISLYCSEVYTKSSSGWNFLQEPWVWGALAFVFPRESARRFLSDPVVFAHRWQGSGDGLRHIDAVIGEWAARNDLKIYFPTPSLVQHIGDVSTLWPAGRVWLARRANRFAGEEGEEGEETGSDD